MNKNLNIECENCESQYVLNYDKGLVMDTTDLKCPFCGELLENIEEIEDAIEEYSTEWDDD